MSQKIAKKDKNLIPTMVLKNDKENYYIYHLKNGDILKFPDKNLPKKEITIQPNQYNLF